MGGIMFQAVVVISLILMLEVFFKIIVAGESKRRYMASVAAMVTVAALAVALAAPNGLDNAADDAAGQNATETENQVADQTITASTKDYNDGVKAFEDGRYSDAIDLFGRVYPKDSNYADAQVKLEKSKNIYAGQLLTDGRARIGERDYGEAVRLLTMALELRPDLAEAQKQLELARNKADKVPNEGSPQKADVNTAWARSHLKDWDFGSGPVGIAVKQVRVTTAVSTVYGFDYAGDEKGRYVWLYISAVNRGSTAVQVDTDDFSLSAGDGYWVTRSEATFSQKYFKPVSLAPNRTNEGWLIFYVPRKTQYTLGYFSEEARVEKAIVY